MLINAPVFPSLHSTRIQTSNQVHGLRKYLRQPKWTRVRMTSFVPLNPLVSYTCMPGAESPPIAGVRAARNSSTWAGSMENALNLQGCLSSSLALCGNLRARKRVGSPKASRCASPVTNYQVFAHDSEDL